MLKEDTRSFGVVLERGPSASRWADWAWKVVAIIPDAPATGGWRELERDGECVRYMAAPFSATLHHKMVETYDANLESSAPSIWAALVEDPSQDPPWKVQGVTLDPYQAQSWQEAAEGLVEKLPMPEETLAWFAGFLKQAPEAPAFKKRRRDSVKVEEQKFGKEPIFSPLGRRIDENDGHL
ncbi:DUF3305 domain-containing protein [Rhizobiales bacterium]|uniref:DUF3305 domain-containing protein n=1 Tax=Hongsoonwoonella zoysiae TaxID=2821844 RepID=UPI001560E415|nr:DUF3305 domain-containing protein [Hongsoonwoonella zoysiae]NRG18371.1 DUF3305 domain-containing protein [Hongsoonwoonella zoysiae]